MSAPVTLALSELRALVTKAARGAGLPWGLAEEAGWAAEWLARRDLPAAQWAAEWMAVVVKEARGPVETGTDLADRLASSGTLGQPEPLPDGLAAPGYLLPFLHRIAQRHGDLVLRADHGVVLRIGPDGTVQFGPCWSAKTEGWRLDAALPVEKPGRPRVTPSLIDCLEGLALRTTVPPSEQSRRDAGSTTEDND